MRMTKREVDYLMDVRSAEMVQLQDVYSEPKMDS